MEQPREGFGATVGRQKQGAVTVSAPRAAPGPPPLRQQTERAEKGQK